MDQNSLPKKNYTFFGLVMILLLLIVTFYSGISLMISKTRYAINDLQVSNLTATSATITWETEESRPTEFRYAPNEAKDLIEVQDERGVESALTHIVTLQDLVPNSIYTFTIGNSNFPVETSFSNFTTQPLSNELNAPLPIYGQIALESGSEVFDDILIHYRVYDPNSKRYSDYNTAMPDQAGRWSGEIFSIKDEWGEPYFSNERIISLLNIVTNNISNVLGEANTSHESFENVNGEVSELIEIKVSNGLKQNSSYTPITADISKEILTIYLNDVNDPQDIEYAYAPAAYCTQYQVYSLNYCSNPVCPVGRYCDDQSLDGAAAIKCVNRSSMDTIVDCCPSGETIQNGVCVGAGQCSEYTTYPLNSCTNPVCPVGRYCQPNPIPNASVKMCVSRSNNDVIADCCASGQILENGRCVTPGICITYGTHALNSCTNNICPVGRYCDDQSLDGAAAVKCLNRGSSDEIVDCCPSGATIQNGVCVSPGICTQYSSYPLNSCTNPVCPVGRYCQPNSITNATVKKCVNRGGGSDVIGDCCAVGEIIENGLCKKPDQCDYGANPLNSCNNTACPSGRYCAARSLNGADVIQCLNRVGNDEILDCCPSGYVVSNSNCVPNASLSPSPSLGVTLSLSPSISPTLSPTPTQSPINGCVVLGGQDKVQVQQTGQRIIDEQIVPFITSQTGFAPFPITFVISGTGAECSTGPSHQITCGMPKEGYSWLTSKLIFHEVMHNYKHEYGSSVSTVISEMMASIMEGYFTRESCMGGEYTFYGLGDTDHTKGRKPDFIRDTSGLSIKSLWEFAITGKTDMFTSTVVNRIVPGGWKFEHIFCNGYKQWGTYYSGIGCGGDSPRALSGTFDINMDILLSPAKLNDFEEGEYRLDLSYKTLNNISNETNKIVPVGLSSASNCKAGEASCQIDDVAVPDVYVNSEAANDPRYDLNVSLNSDIKNDLNCWNRTVDMEPNANSPINMELDLVDMSCTYSFGGIPVKCDPKDLATDGIVAPWRLAPGAAQSQGYSSSHPGIDVTSSEGATLVAAQNGTVIYTRRGEVKDSIYFDSVKWGTKCEEGSRLNPDNWICVCDWCPLDKVRNGAASRPDLCNAQRDCVARAEQLQRNHPDWSVDGALHRIYGNVVIIEHENHRSIYSHMGKINVAPGNCVQAGDVIGTMSSTGSSSGTHIHFEVRNIAGSIINPSGLPCSGDGCGLMSLMPGSGNYLNYLGLATDELPDFYEGDIDLSEERPFSLDQGVYGFASPVGDSKGLIAKQDDLEPNIFIDKNKNNIADQGETKLTSSALQNLTQIEGLQDIRLNNNWNLVVFNASSDTIVTTKDLAELAELSGMHLEIASYDQDRWTISTVRQEGNEMVFFGNEVYILPQKALFVRSSAPGTYYHSGLIQDSNSNTLELKLGWNFFSLSSDIIEKAKPTSYSILQVCRATGIDCSLFSDFNGQLENPVLYRQDLYGREYDLSPDKGYVIKVESNPGTITF